MRARTTASPTPTREYPDSWYAATRTRDPERPAAQGELRTDVLVIGGGYTGLSAALHLAEAGIDVLLVEAGRVGWSASGRNGGQVGSGQRRDQDELERWFGRIRARALWDLAQEAKALVRDLVTRHRIDCDLKPGILTVAHSPKMARWCLEYADKLRREYDYDEIEPLDRDELRHHIGSRIYHGGWLDRGGAHLHPLNYALGLARAAEAAGARIHENTPARRYRREGAGILVETPRARIRAGRLVLACNAHVDGLEPRIARRIMPIHNYIIATEPLGEERARTLIPNDVAVADTKFVIDYYRLSGDRRLLFGGGESYRARLREDVKEFVRPCMLRVFPELKDVRIDYGWGGTLAVTLPRMPDFGRSKDGRVLHAQGYSGHGVALATLAGRLIAEAIAGDDARFQLMASIPVPAFPGGRLLRWPAFVLGMLWFSLQDRL